MAAEALLRPGYSADDDDGVLVKSVLLQALSDLPKLQTGLGNADLKVQVNITARDLIADTFWETLLHCLHVTQTPAKFLVLELTEHFAIENIEKTRKNMAQCTALGVQIFLDDFGCGFSNLEWLVRLPVAGLKFDRAMVASYRSRKTATVFRHLCAMAEDLGWQTTAEGVEDLADISDLIEIGFTHFQGFALCKPAAIGAWDMGAEFTASSPGGSLHQFT